jgi:hypothetical protein
LIFAGDDRTLFLEKLIGLHDASISRADA